MATRRGTAGATEIRRTGRRRAGVEEVAGGGFGAGAKCSTQVERKKCGMGREGGVQQSSERWDGSGRERMRKGTWNVNSLNVVGKLKEVKR